MVLLAHESILTSTWHWLYRVIVMCMLLVFATQSALIAVQREGFATHPRNENRNVTVLAPLSLVKERSVSHAETGPFKKPKSPRFLLQHTNVSVAQNWQACAPKIESMTGHHNIKDLWKVTRLDRGNGLLSIDQRSALSILLPYCLSFLLSLTTWNLAIGSPVLYSISLYDALNSVHSVV